MEDKTIADWIAASDPIEQRAIVDDVASSIHAPLPCSLFASILIPTRD
jgi:hypothetical protein